MSWQDYVDKQLVGSGSIKYAAIIGTDGSLWAKSSDFNLSSTEITTLAKNYSNTAHFQSNGITLNNTRFIFLSATDRVLRAKKNKEGLHCIKNKTCIIIGVYEEPITAPQAATVVEKLGEYLYDLSY